MHARLAHGHEGALRNACQDELSRDRHIYLQYFYLFMTSSREEFSLSFSKADTCTKLSNLTNVRYSLDAPKSPHERMGLVFDEKKFIDFLSIFFVFS